MSYLRQSQNYIWNTSAVLGKGATGAVYAGLHKLTGESVAVKSFNHLSHMRPYEVCGLSDVQLLNLLTMIFCFHKTRCKNENSKF